MSFCSADMHRQPGSALPQCMLLALVEDSLLRACASVSKGSGRDSVWGTSSAMQGA